jgi:hypothetical protein
MKHELIKTENYLLVLSDENIKVGDWYLVNQYGRGLLLCTQPATEEDIKHQRKYDCKLIIAHLPLDGAPYLDGVDVLPDIEDNEILQYISKNYYKVNSFDELNGELLAVCNAILNTKEAYKYTEEDMERAIYMGRKGKIYQVSHDEVDIDGTYTTQEIIQSLNQPKLPIAFECGMEVKEIENAAEVLNVSIPKTTTNSEGRTEWVGKYLF